MTVAPVTRDHDRRLAARMLVEVARADGHVTSDEFCHFMEGRATYVHESGEVTEIYPNTAAFFPKDWKGTCTVHEQIKKTYMIR